MPPVEPATELKPPRTRYREGEEDEEEEEECHEGAKHTDDPPDILITPPSSLDALNNTARFGPNENMLGLIETALEKHHQSLELLLQSWMANQSAWQQRLEDTLSAKARGTSKTIARNHASLEKEFGLRQTGEVGESLFALLPPSRRQTVASADSGPLSNVLRTTVSRTISACSSLTVTRRKIAPEIDKAERALTLTQGTVKSARVRLQLRDRDSSSSTANECMRVLRRLVLSRKFDIFFGCVILGNSVFIGLQVEYKAPNGSGTDSTCFVVFDYIFYLLFFVECVLRLCALGIGGFLCGQMWAWNILDLILIVVSSLSIILQSIYVSHGESENDPLNLKITRFLRFGRIVRSLRLFRVMRFFRQLRILVSSIFATLKSLLCACGLLFIIMYVFGIIFTEGVAEHLEAPEGSEQPAGSSALRRAFGSLPRTVFSLFKSVCGGENWGNIVDPLSDLNWAYVAAFNSYIAFVYFAVLNVMTGVFCQSAIETAQKDADLVVQDLLNEKDELTRRLREVFSDTFDEFQSGELTLAQFEYHLSDERLQAVFASMSILVDDGWTMFKLLDVRKTGVINIDDFVEGCLRIRGPAKKLDLMRISSEQRVIVGMLQDMMAKSKGTHNGQLCRLHDVPHGVERDFLQFPQGGHHAACAARELKQQQRPQWWPVVGRLFKITSRCRGSLPATRRPVWRRRSPPTASLSGLDNANLTAYCLAAGVHEVLPGGSRARLRRGGAPLGTRVAATTTGGGADNK